MFNKMHKNIFCARMCIFKLIYEKREFLSTGKHSVSQNVFVLEGGLIPSSMGGGVGGGVVSSR